MDVEPFEEIVVTIDEANAVFDRLCQQRRPDGKRWTQRKISKVLGVDQSTVSRNQRYRKAGKNVSDDLYKKIADILREQRLQELQQRHLKEQAEAAAAAETKRESDEKERQRRIKAEHRADEVKEREQRAAEKAEGDRRAGVLSRLEPYWADMRAKGLSVSADPAKEGDAPYLLAEAKPSDIRYPTFELAAIALTSDDQLYPCGQTAAQLRQGRTAWHRLTGKYSQPKNRLEVVPPILRPDAESHYADDYEDILSWQGMNEEFSSLVLEPLPLIVSPDTAKGFSQFISLDEHLCDEGYLVMSSCLKECGDVERRLQEIKRRTVLPRVGAGALKVLKWVGIFVAIVAATLMVVAAALMALMVLLVMAFTVWQIGSWGVDTAISVWEVSFAWVDSAKWQILGVAVIGIFLGLAFWWAWPKESDRRNFPRTNIVGWRFFAVGGSIALVVMLTVVVAGIMADIEANQENMRYVARVVRESIYIPRVISP